ALPLPGLQRAGGLPAADSRLVVPPLRSRAAFRGDRAQSDRAHHRARRSDAGALQHRAWHLLLSSWAQAEGAGELLHQPAAGHDPRERQSCHLPRRRVHRAARLRAGVNMRTLLALTLACSGCFFKKETPKTVDPLMGGSIMLDAPCGYTVTTVN